MYFFEQYEPCFWGGGGVIDGVGVGWGNIIKEKFMYDTSTSSMTSSTGLKPIQSCYDKGT